MRSTSSYLQELLAREGPRVRAIEILGLARLDPDDPADFARTCLASGACELSADECRRIFWDHGEALYSVVRPADLLSLPLEKEYFHVTFVRLAWKSVLSSLRPKLVEALKNDELQEKLRGHDPVEALQKWVNDEFISGSEGRQRDLKPVLRMLEEDLKAVYTGIAKIASVLELDPSDYAETVVAACCNPSAVPQKGLGFALTLLARAGGSKRSFGSTFQNNLELFLSDDFNRLKLNTGRSTYGRLSETKTVLSALQLAHVEKGRHFVRPDFPPAVKDFLQTIL